MSSVYPCIYLDYADNIWKFFRNNNEELCYKLMYGEGRWTKESLIDKEVLGFAVYVDGDGTIHIVYSNIKGELKYCTMKNKQWVGKRLYHMDFDEFQIEHLKVEIIGQEMHIFFLLISNNGSDHGVLMHCIWDGRETRVTSIHDIILASNLKEYYLISVDSFNNIDVFFMTDEGDEVSLKYCSFADGKWSPAKRIYGIQGDDIDFEVVRDQEQDFHILNKSREGAMYFIEHVCMDISGNIKAFRVRESNKRLLEPILFIQSNKLCACWIEQDQIFYSFFDNEKWGNPFCFDKDNELGVMKYNCFMCCNGESSIKSVEIYGTDEPDLYLFIPNEFAINMNDLSKYKMNQVSNTISSKEDEEIRSLKFELSKLKSEKKNLEKKIALLNMQSQKKESFMEDYEERLARILEQKRKAEENYNVFLELQQNIQKELEYTKQQLTQERNVRIDIENKLKESKEQILMIKQQVQIINEEKKKLQEELEVEKNQSIMERLLRKRTSGI